MKLYISDMDGTLLNSDKEISKYTRDTINALGDSGVHFSVATARTAASAVRILSGVNITMPAVLMNGAAVYDMQKKEYIKTEAIPEQAANAVIEVLKEQGLAGFMYSISGNQLITYYETLSTQALQDFYNERMMKYNKSFEKADSFLNLTSGNKIMYFSLLDEQEPLSKAFNALKGLPDIDMALYRDVYTQGLWYLEIFCKNASKYNAVKFIRDYFGFESITGFGDNFNDMPLLRACDEFYAVSNAVHELKEKATGVIGDHNSDGVARFMAAREKWPGERNESRKDN